MRVHPARTLLVSENGISSIPGFAEPVASWSHLLGAIVFVVLTVPLLRRGWNGPSTGRAVVPRTARMIGLGSFCFAAVSLFSVSGTYHLVALGGTARDVMLRLDYAFIYVVIGASFTPCHIFLFTGIARWGPLLFIWTAAITGLTLFAVFGEMPNWFGVILFGGLGWCGLLTAILACKRYGLHFVEWLLLSGAIYTVGAALQLARQPVLIPGVIGPHELFHLAVLGGAISHWLFIYQFADGQLPKNCIGKKS